MTANRSGVRYGAYHRISRSNGRDFDADNTISDKDAFERIDGWAKMAGKKIVERYLDVDQSGSKMSRPALDRMLADLAAGRIDGIVVAQVDRLSRADVGDALAVIRQILGDPQEDESPRPLVLLDLGIDPSTEFGEFGLTILLGLARMQWRRYRRQWSSAQKRAVARGVWIGPAPFGYRTTIAGYDKHGQPVAGPLEEHPEHGPVVREAFRLAARVDLHAAIDHLKAAAPDKRWRTDEARRLLASRAYRGEVWGAGERKERAHPPLATPDVFAAAQSESRGRRRSGGYALSGVAVCGGCEADLVGALQTVRDRKYRRMRCSVLRPGCVGSVSAERLDAHVRAELKEAAADDDFTLQFVAGDLSAARNALEAAKAERRRYAKDVRARELFGEEDYYAGAEERATEVRAAQEHYDAIATANERVAELPAAHELDDDSKLVRFIRATGVRITVAPGRGTIAERVSIAAADDDDGVGVLAA